MRPSLCKPEAEADAPITPWLFYVLLHWQMSVNETSRTFAAGYTEPNDNDERIKNWHW